MDLAKNGKISYTEFLTAGCDHKNVITKENIKKAFSLFDANHDGHINIKEFKFALPKANDNALRFAFEPEEDSPSVNNTSLSKHKSLFQFNK